LSLTIDASTQSARECLGAAIHLDQTPPTQKLLPDKLTAIRKLKKIEGVFFGAKSQKAWRVWPIIRPWDVKVIPLPEEVEVGICTFFVSDPHVLGSKTKVTAHLKLKTGWKEGLNIRLGNFTRLLKPITKMITRLEERKNTV
jgi:hypothetical protein